MSFFRNLFGKHDSEKNTRLLFKSLEEVVNYYKDLGFFKDQNVDAVVENYKEEWSKSPDVNDPWNDALLLSTSGSGVWRDDPECDVCSGDNAYVDCLNEWAELSSGIFNPTDVKEEWASEKGPITVNFTLNGKPCILFPEFQDDWLDLMVLVSINDLIAKTGYQFECALDGNFCMLLCIQPELKQKMKLDRKFPFAW